MGWTSSFNTSLRGSDGVQFCLQFCTLRLDGVALGFQLLLDLCDGLLGGDTNLEVKSGDAHDVSFVSEVVVIIGLVFLAKKKALNGPLLEVGGYLRRLRFVRLNALDDATSMKM